MTVIFYKNMPISKSCYSNNNPFETHLGVAREDDRAQAQHHDEPNTAELDDVDRGQETGLVAPGQVHQEEASDDAGYEAHSGEDGAGVGELLECDGGEGDGDDHSSARGDVEQSRLEGVEAVSFDDDGVFDSETTLQVGDGGEQEEHPGLGVLQSLDELVTLPDLGLDTVLVGPDALDDVDLVLLGQEDGVGGVIGHPPEVEDRDAQGEQSDDDEEPLPRPGVGLHVDVGDTVCQEGGEDLGDTVALEGPAETLGDLDAGVEHGDDGHDARGDAAFRGTEEEAEGD